MNLLQLKISIVNLKNIKLRNFYFMFFCKGKRGTGTMLLPLGNFHYRVEKNAKINIKNGSFILNTDFSKPNPFTGVLKMNDNAVINVAKTFEIFSSFHIIVMGDATLNLGSGYINSGLKIRCFKEITIGENVAISENVTIWDTDAHFIVGKEAEMTKPIKIGNHVWIGNNVTILKGVTVGDGAIIAAGAVVTRNVPEKCLAAGVPAKVIKENVDWN